MDTRRILVPFALFAVLACGSASVQAQPPLVAMHVGAPVHPVTLAGGQRLVYELHVANKSGAPVGITGADVLDADGKPLLHLDPEALARDADLGNGGRILAPGAQGVLYLQVDTGTSAPASIRHRLTLRQSDRDTAITGADVPVIATSAATLAPPLAGGPWVAVYGYEWPRGHRRVFITTDGDARLPARFAIDWMKVDEHGRTLKDDSGLVTSSYSWGAEVLAVADARVAEVRDGTTEATRIADNQTHPHPDAAGNFISLDLGNGRYATYEHLRAGTLRVAKGEHVQKGQVIAQVGFSGDATEPHLHFHVSDSPRPVAGEGLPCFFGGFRVIGRVTDWNGFGSQRWTDLPPRRVDHAFPDPGDVVDFD